MIPDDIERISVMDAVERIKSGREFWIVFHKRTTGETRVMEGQYGIRSMRGGDRAYDFDEKNLLCVWDLEKKAYRTIPIEGIRCLRMDGLDLEVVQ